MKNEIIELDFLKIKILWFSIPWIDVISAIKKVRTLFAISGGRGGWAFLQMPLVCVHLLPIR